MTHDIDTEMRGIQTASALWIAHKDFVAICLDGNEWVVVQHTSDGSTSPQSRYSTPRLAASRILQLLHIGPVAAQTYPEICEIGSVVVQNDKGMDSLTPTPLAASQTPAPIVNEETNTPQRITFWHWLPLAYRDGHVGSEAKFTKYNMEVAHLAGWDAALTFDAIAPQPDPIGAEWMRREAYDSLFKHPGFIRVLGGQQFKAVKLEDAAEGIRAIPLPTEADLLAEALRLPEVKALVDAAEWLGVCAQTTGGVAGRDDDLVAAVDRLASALAALTEGR